MYAVWVVEREGLAAVSFVSTFPQPEDALSSAARVLFGLGALSGVKARNTSWGTHGASLLVGDISDRLPLAVIVTGAVIEEDGAPVADDVVGSFGGVEDPPAYH